MPRPAAAPARSTSLAKPDVENGEPLSEVNTKADFGSCSRCSRRKARISSPRIGCVAGVPFLGPANVQGGGLEVDLIPAQIDKLTDPQAVAVGHEDHGRITVTPAVVSGGLDQLLDLGGGEMFTRAIRAIREPPRRDRPIYGGRNDDSES